MQEVKYFQVRMPKDLWLFLKQVSAEKEIPMAEIINKSIAKLKKSYEKSVDEG